MYNMDDITSDAPTFKEAGLARAKNLSKTRFEIILVNLDLSKMNVHKKLGTGFLPLWSVIVT